MTLQKRATKKATGMSGLSNRRHVVLLYSSQDDPVDHSVRLVLKEKDIGVEITFVPPNECPEFVKERNPYSATKILTLVDRDLSFYEPDIIMEYLDERYPHPPLLPIGPGGRASNRQYRDRIKRDMYSLLGKIRDKKSGGGKAAAEKRALQDHLSTLSHMFAHKPYFMSDDFTLVDCCMAPLLWRLRHYGINLPAAARPIKEYSQRLFERKSFQCSLSEVEKQYEH